MLNYNDNEDNIEFENHEFEESEDLSTQRKIFTEAGDPEVISLYNRWKRGTLNLQPDFQRNFVWDKQNSSKLVESILLGIPIPVIYLSEQSDGKVNVIDGQQRLTALFSYRDGTFPNGNEFKLTGLKAFPEYNNKKFDQLDSLTQEKIETYNIRAITFKKESDKDLQFEIFSRLNKGSVSLNEQELRNCIYRGQFNELIKELSQNKDFMYLLGVAEPHKRMLDRELVLRFAAFYFRTYLHYTSPVKKFLNDTLEEYKDLNEKKSKELKSAFENSISVIKSLFDKQAFKRFNTGTEKNRNGSWEPKKFNTSLYDILMYSFAKLDKNTAYQNLDVIREAFIDLMTNDMEFMDSVTKGTSDASQVITRFDKWRHRLESIVAIGQKEPRCFSYKLKEALYENDPTCAICGNKIQNIDDAAVDHIEQYWLGGKTIPENARLSHRYCNNHRGRRD